MTMHVYDPLSQIGPDWIRDIEMMILAEPRGVGKIRAEKRLAEEKHMPLSTARDLVDRVFSRMPLKDRVATRIGQGNVTTDEILDYIMELAERQERTSPS